MLAVENITKRFGSNVAVNDVSFSVAKGEIHGLIGPNGSGKTTLFNVVSGFYVPTDGNIRFEDKPIGGLSPHRVAREGLIRTFQLTSVFRGLSVRESVDIARNVARSNPSLSGHGNWLADFRETDAILEYFDLASSANRHADVLPGGVQRTLSIATALAARPRMLLLDEPLAGLNPTEKAKIAAKIRALRDGFGLTVLLVEHDIKSVFSVCDNITVINIGRKIAEGTASEIAANETVIRAYLGSAGVNNAGR
ncbi:ABC transporter ATP-binding protein [Shinella daejeonensis]|uniref:ABC transporter ATP-binding protein n=1 Tax=Shinella daejeonensis TaxID=659017 RepID=UPI0020C7847B|nr:ABC transporter ATP-binding protein [Shinella daejeonensis]MCP8894740.1 ABC transporter ATP-binding protein [Shinella daejeonensis]